MATAAEIQARIDAIDVKIASGVRSVAVNDEQITYDLELLAKERERLVRQLAAQSVSRFQRVVFKHV